jgi:hypothetical protein
VYETAASSGARTARFDLVHQPEKSLLNPPEMQIFAPENYLKTILK